MTVLVGGVGELYQGDLDLGRRVVEELAGSPLGPDVLVEDLHYGAIAVAQRLAEVGPAALVVVGAAERGRAPATVTRRRIQPSAPDVADFQAAMHDAGTGYVTIDLLLSVCAGLDALPARTVVLEVEPAALGPAAALSDACLAVLPEVLWHVRTEVGRMPLLELVDRLRPMINEERLQPAPALEVIRALLGEMRGLDSVGHWGSAFSLRDRLRLNISAGETPEGMEHEDWALWWALIEELDRLQGAEAV